MRWIHLNAGWGGVAVLSLAALTSFSAVPTPQDIAFFEKKVRPLLVEHCYKCHSSDAERIKGGLFLDSQAGWMNGGDSGEALLPGQPDKSLLIEAVRYENPDLQMPPKYRLSDAEIQTLERWIAMGAPDPRAGDAQRLPESSINIESGREFWAFQPPRDTPPPIPSNLSWCKDDLDRFILRALEDAELQPVDDADRRTLIRRLSFDLLGLPPSPQEIRQFLNDPRDDDQALERLVDRLLASPRFGERWARHWLDVVRYAESMGRTRNWPFPFAWRYRDYVIDALNDDKPYDRFLIEQLAGDLLPSESPAQADLLKVATGFLALGSQDLNERNAANFKMDVVDEQIDVTCRAFMALTTGCARCHDHKFDPIPTRDYYAMAGIFGSTELRAGYTNRKGGNNRDYFHPELLLTLSAAAEPDTPPDRKAGRQRENALNRQRQKLQQQIVEKTSDIQRLNQMAKNQNKRRAQDDDATSSLTPARLRQQLNRLKREVRDLRAALKSQDESPAVSEHMAMGVVDGTPRDCRIHVRGDTSTLGPAVPRGFLQVLCNDSTPPLSGRQSGRLELAQWMTHPDHPLTGRVMVNRIWHHLFGHGLVATVDNFGETGERPTHPELLDHLATRFIANDWSVKSMIRTIVLSRTYRLSSRHDEAAHAADPENHLLWRMNLRRLEVEALRDAMLAVSGQLDLEPAIGSPVMTARMGDMGRRSSSAQWAQSDKRTVYLPVVRNDLPGMFEVFDFAEPSSVIGRRDITTVSTQALFMMNNPLVLEQSNTLAALLARRHPSQPEARVQLAYEMAFGRLPESDEERRALAFVMHIGDSPDAWSALCQALFASAEFRYLQ